MTLFVSKYTDISKISKEFELAIIYNQPHIYNKISTKKVLLDKQGKILKENFFETSKQKISIEGAKHILYRLFLIEMNAVKYKQTLEMYGKQKQKIQSSYNSLIYHQKYKVSQIQTVELSTKLLADYDKAMFGHFLGCVEFYHGKRFVHIYHEALSVLWHISTSLFTIELYQKFTPIKEYKYLLYSYSLYFCVNFIKRYKFDIDDVDEEYYPRHKTIANIYKLFVENLSNKLDKKINIYQNITHELELISTIKKFEV